jgi:hypothetical protein
MASIARGALVVAAIFSVVAAPVALARTPWCGIYMERYFGLHDSRLAMARSWAVVGENAGGPCDGCVVVWPHHVGVLVGQSQDGRWLVHSGNDGNAVRTRARSLAGAIAFRRVGRSVLLATAPRMQTGFSPEWRWPWDPAPAPSHAGRRHRHG